MKKYKSIKEGYRIKIGEKKRGNTPLETKDPPGSHINGGCVPRKYNFQTTKARTDRIRGEIDNAIR